MLSYNTFYINALRFSKNVFSIILKIVIIIIFLLNALMSVSFKLLLFNLFIIHFFTCFYFRFISNLSRCLSFTSLLMLLFSLSSYFSRFLIITLIIICLRFLNAF